MLFLIAGDDDSYSFYGSPTQEAWLRWEWESCIERHGDHLWLLSLLDPEDGWAVDVECGYCGVHIEYLYDDAHVMLYGELEVCGVTIEISEGMHGDATPHLFQNIPVNVKLEVEKHFNPLDMIVPEYDYFLVLSSRS